MPAFEGGEAHPAALNPLPADAVSAIMQAEFYAAFRRACIGTVELAIPVMLNHWGIADIPEEPLGWMVWLGAAMVVAGGALAALPGRANGAVSQQSGE